MSGLFDQLRLFGEPRGPARSERHIQLGGQIVTYQLVRSTRRTVGITIDARGLRVGAPHRVTLPEIERFLLQHAEWVLEKLAGWRSSHGERFLPVDGAVVPILGEPWTLRLDAGNNRLHWQESSREVCLAMRRNADAREVLRRLLRDHALDVFIARAVRFESMLPVALPPLSLSNALTRWGSCSSKSGVRLNWRLIHLPYAQIDYVIAHEFAHLSHMDHSPRFWAEVARLCPEFEQSRAELKRLAASIPKI